MKARDEAALMKRAIALARRAEGDTGHYPMVGAIIVKGGRVVGEGYFRKPGEPHAEVHAIRRAGARARGATLVLNLEPCSHHGRTPPCADAVIAAGIKKVVAGMTDPNPLVSGQGFEKLRKAGIEVKAGVMENECRDLNRVFVKFITTRRPYVIMKAAATMDGKIATSRGDSRWVSGQESRKKVHRLRDVCQAVMVGAGTVRADDCRLSARLAGKGRHPRPVIVTTGIDIPVSCRVMKTPAAGGPLIFCTERAPKTRIKKFRDKGAEVVTVRADREGGASLKQVMRELHKKKIASVLLEGGSALFGSALRAGVVDELLLFIAPRLLAGDGIPITGGKGPLKMAGSIPLREVKVSRVGKDLMVSARVGSE